MMSVDILDRGFSDSLLVPDLTYTVKDYEWDVMGGPNIARIEATGDEEALWQLRRWLRAPVIIRDELGTPVWWGYVRGVSLQVDGIDVGVSLDEMYNKVASLYSDANDLATSTRQVTAWAQDDDSILEYGTKELVESQGNQSAEEALARRDKLLDLHKYPTQITRPSTGEGHSATIECAGWWETLDWQHFSRSAGGIKVVADEEQLQRICWGDQINQFAQSITPQEEIITNPIYLKIGTTGTPGSDLRVTLRPDDAGVPSSTVLYSIDIPVDDCDGGWVEIDFGQTITLSASTVYWIHLDRVDGGSNNGNHYTIAMDPNGSYAYGDAIVWSLGDPTSDPDEWWDTGDVPGGDAIMDIPAFEQTTDQIEYILTNAAQFIEGIEIEATSGVYTKRYRNGDHTSLHELESLLLTGVSDGSRLLAEVTLDRHVRIYEEPARPSGRASYIWQRDATMRTSISDRDVTSSCPVGDWVEVVGVPAVPEGDLLSGSNLFFVEHARYTPEDNRYSPVSRTAKGEYQL